MRLALRLCLCVAACGPSNGVLPAEAGSIGDDGDGSTGAATSGSDDGETAGEGAGQTQDSGSVSDGHGSGDTGASGEEPYEGVRQVDVSTSEELAAALADARPGDVIELVDGTYLAEDTFVAAADGSEDLPIVLRGSRQAVLTTGDYGDSGYGLHVTGEHWHLEGFRVTNSAKGIVLDDAPYAIISGVEVDTIGEEAVHFRQSSHHGIIRESDIHDTGLEQPRYGEGIYIGSAHSNWDTHGNTDGIDASDGVLVEDNRISNTSAEGIDIKEGTTGGIIRGNVFVNAGYSGENYADSWVDVKGNGYEIVDNNGYGTLLDAFQTHEVVDGWGGQNVFRGNVVEGGVPGFTVSIAPADNGFGNVVDCDNTPSGAGISNIECT